MNKEKRQLGKLYVTTTYEIENYNKYFGIWKFSVNLVDLEWWIKKVRCNVVVKINALVLFQTARSAFCEGSSMRNFQRTKLRKFYTGILPSAVCITTSLASSAPHLETNNKNNN